MSSKPAESLVPLAEAILARTISLSEGLSRLPGSSPSTLEHGADSALWTTSDAELTSLQSDILGLTERLTRLLLGPHGFLHEYVSTNWELGALYTLLEFDVLDKIPLPGAGAARTLTGTEEKDGKSGKRWSVSVEQLAALTGLPTDKLRRICRLVACAGILEEEKEGWFGHTAISEELLRDRGFRSWVGFQLYETRVASAHLADSLRKPNPFWTGRAAFEHAWGAPMYEWHAKHPEKGRRFAQAMEGVAQGLDPGVSMVTDCIAGYAASPTSPLAGGKGLVVDLAGATGAFCVQLATAFPGLQFEVRDASADLLHRGQQGLPTQLAQRVTFRHCDLRGDYSAPEDNERQPCVLLLRSGLWGLPDAEVVALLRRFAPVLRRPGTRPVLVICDLVSPDWGTFAPHEERAYRRRDVTLMTMHNARMRTMREWLALIAEALPGLEVKHGLRYTSHSCRGLWEVRVGGD